jgi:hypothetical protein
MSWNYRVCKKSLVSTVQPKEKILEYSIREVHYDEHGDITSYTLSSCQLAQAEYESDSTEQKFIEQFKFDLKKMLECLEKEVIDLDELDRMFEKKNGWARDIR